MLSICTSWAQDRRFSGVTLTQCLISDEQTPQQKIEAVGAAAWALRRLHAETIEWPDGQEKPLSHGDATADNVIIDVERNTARWFDFDTVHDAAMTPSWRSADDLRALTYSSACHVDLEQFPSLVGAMVASYGRGDALAEAVAFWSRRPNSFHLAQAGISYAHRQFFDRSLLETIR